MKKILGLDLGTNSIGWAVVNEAENADEKSSIIKLGVRVNPLTVDELTNFEKGKSITTNADRTLKRSMRRNLQRYKLRRENLIEVMKSNGFINDNSILTENGNKTTFETYRLRAKAATDEISLEEFARVLLMINKKRGYKSSRKAKSTEEGQLIDGMDVAKQLYENNLTPGQFSLNLLKQGKKYLPDFYRSDLQAEFDKVWNFQKQFYTDILTDSLKDDIRGKNKSQTWAICAKPFNIVGFKRTGKTAEQKIENYQWRANALSEKLGLEELAVVLSEINGQSNNASGYLGNISDRSKALYFNHQTVGQYQMAKLAANPNYSLKNEVFYRQDYLNEFETIWETQAKYHKELTYELKKEIRDVVIFYQRPLKSQKGLISFCELESKEIEVDIDGKKVKKITGSRVCPKSSPLFQEFKIWQILNNIQVTGKVIPNDNPDLFGKAESLKNGKRFLYQEEKEKLFNELNTKEKLSKNEAIKLLFDKTKDIDLNYKEIEGNKTQAALFNAYRTIIEMSGHDEELKKKTIADIFKELKINTDILQFDSNIDAEQQPMYKLWHLLYSFEGDNSVSGNEKLIKKLKEQYGFDKEYAEVLAKVVFQPDYGSLSAKAIKKILPHMKDGLEYSVACEYAGYNHSKRSLTKEELDNKVLKDKLELLPRNSLRNPVVEKILNQMINVVNEIIDEYGKPDEVRIELARELKKSAKEREELTASINQTTKLHEEYVKILKSAPFNLEHVSRNDIIRYKLYKELEKNGYKTLYSNTYIPQEKVFSKEFDIEHIIPQAKLFDDSFSNKTLEVRNVNLKKSNATAYDFVLAEYGEKKADEYTNRIENLYADKVISKTKRDKLLMKEADIPSGFINRDLRDSQYIAKQAREMLEGIVKFVVPTTGSITDRLREDWQLVDVMQELNWDKYDQLGLTYYEQDRDGRQIKRIKDWTKRNDHRHHAMDALTIAFTKHSFIQYLNNLNARVQKGTDEYFDLDMVELMDLSKEERSSAIYGIEKKELERDSHGKLRFKPPIPLDEFRAEAKRQLENILISIKAKNKVVTQNINTTKKKGGKNKRVQLTPRGQLHLETVYGSSKKYVIKEEKVNASFDTEKIMTVASPRYREALLARLNIFGNDPKKAFTGKNTLEKLPEWLNESHTEKVPEKVKTIDFETIYTIRKEISPDLKIDKVVDAHIRKILEDRLAKFGGDAKKAFSNLDENPIYLNKDKGIKIKRVTITGINNAIALHDKRDKNGNPILDSNGNKMPSDFVNTGNNHHVAIFRKPKLDKEGKPITNENGEIVYELDEVIVSFFEATSRTMLGIPIIDKDYKKDEGWQFLFTMKQNEYFVFPRYDEDGNMTFNPHEHDENWYKNPENYAEISPNLYRVQKIATRNYFFRHHLETTVAEPKELKGITYKPQLGLNGIVGILKVRVNHIGKIVSVGEY
ncbi:MAG: type II CRISPR RNA-guided endonuclease Cas9 [Bacteroidales bacterium]|nr:type II CRISPR RNA-guided endonuclease Cas9 [Bacteroidales bacterium]